jgi:hypothetical protein
MKMHHYRVILHIYIYIPTFTKSPAPQTKLIRFCWKVFRYFHLILHNHEKFWTYYIVQNVLFPYQTLSSYPVLSCPVLSCKKPLLTYIRMNVLSTSRSWILLEKLTRFQLVTIFPAFFGTRSFITVFISARHLFLSWASSIHSITHISLPEVPSSFSPPIYAWRF